jgi:hypothetical protein
MTPSQLNVSVTAQQNAARFAGDRDACMAALADSWTSRADWWIYQAAWIGIPLKYVDPTFGRWSVPEDMCWSCWKPVEGPLVREMCNAECRHYHPACRPGHDTHLWDGEHCWNCTSRIPCYYA